MKKCAMPLLEPLVDHRPKEKWFKEVDVLGGGAQGGIVTIGSLKTTFEEEWNKMTEEFILKACKSFLRSVDTIIE